MASTSDIVPNWVQSTPDPNVTIGQSCTPFKVEMVIRGYMSGHSAREYKEGKRILCGEEMPDGIIENDAFDEPIITPATKANEGHDEDISKDEIIQKSRTIYWTSYDQKYNCFYLRSVKLEEAGFITLSPREAISSISS